uniref:Uncharacterized protein n=1 Tax=Romanomermis culicivorax TaxID=13658 RepID=A0A915HXN6_ROMCU
METLKKSSANGSSRPFDGGSWVFSVRPKSPLFMATVTAGGKINFSTLPGGGGRTDCLLASGLGKASDGPGSATDRGGMTGAAFGQDSTGVAGKLFSISFIENTLWLDKKS